MAQTRQGGFCELGPKDICHQRMMNAVSLERSTPIFLELRRTQDKCAYVPETHEEMVLFLRNGPVPKFGPYRRTEMRLQECNSHHPCCEAVVPLLRDEEVLPEYCNIWLSGGKRLVGSVR